MMRSVVIRQWQLFLLALAFLTRVPIPPSVPFSHERLNRANRYFGLVGVVVGASCALCFEVSQWLFNKEVAVLMAMITGLLLTGVFHEDGLADSADGLGGGQSKEAKLAIMKDSRIGTYGATALVMALLFKFVLLMAIEPVGLALVVAHALSRTFAASLLASLPYVQSDATSKSKPLACQQNQADRTVLAFIAVLLLLALPWPLALSVMGVTWALRQGIIYQLRRLIGGYTGDTLGASQQMSELSIYLCFLLPWVTPWLQGAMT